MTPPESVEVELRHALARFPSGVTVVTTTDGEGAWRGFTASSFCSLSADPPLVIVCLARSADCFGAFMATERWVIHILPAELTDLAVRFATRGADKFAGGEFTADARGLPVLEGASVTLHCEAHERLDGGDHVILVGRVTHSAAGERPPAVYLERTFGVFADPEE